MTTLANCNKKRGKMGRYLIVEYKRDRKAWGVKRLKPVRKIH
jgi:hypothetical protein